MTQIINPMKFASGNGEEERDRTPLSLSTEGEVTKPGKFWVYERIIRIPYYGIYEINSESNSGWLACDSCVSPVYLTRLFFKLASCIRVCNTINSALNLGRLEIVPSGFVQGD